VGESSPRKIILSYRRGDSADIAGRIFDRLVQHFGSGRVFIDIDSIPAGADFHDHLHDALRDCGAILAIIGKSWSGPRRGRGSRIMDEDDWVRLEVETALTKQIAVFPILVGGAELPTRQQLPEALAPLLRRNAVPVDSGRDFHPHMNRLIAELERTFGEGLAPADPDPPAASPDVAPLYTPAKAAWRLPAAMVRPAFAATAVLLLASLALLLGPTLETLTVGEPGERRLFDAALALAAVPAPGKVAIALAHAVVVALAFVIGGRIDVRLWYGLLAGSLLALLAAVYLYFYTGPAFHIDELAQYPYASGVLEPIIFEGGDYDGRKAALYASLRAWIYLGMVWNLLLAVALVRNRADAEAPARSPAEALV